MYRWWERLLHHFVPAHANDYRPHLLRTSWLIFFVAVTIVAEGLFVATLMNRSASDPFFAAVVTSEVISLTNSERQGQHLLAVTENKKLSAAAQAKAQDMASKGYFSHRGPDGQQPWVWMEKAGYAYQYAGENLAVQFVDSTDVVNAWMASPTHRANIVKTTYTEVGVGVAEGMYQGRLVTFVVQFFATPRPAAASVQKPFVAAEFPAPSASVPQVAGAAVEPPPEAAVEEPPLTPTLEPAPAPGAAESLRDTLRTFLAHVATQPRAVTNMLLGGLLALVLTVVVLTVVVHIHIQPGKLIVGGVVVAAIVFVCLAANSTLLSSSVSTQEAASTVFAIPAFSPLR